MAEKVSVIDFVTWCVENIDPAELSALMEEYNYTDDSVESVMDALESEDGFATELGLLLGRGLKEKYTELNKAIGGVRVQNDDLDIADWHGVITSQRINRASGDASASSSSGKFDWNALVANVLSAASTITTAALGKTTTTTTATGASSESGVGKSIALYIIIAVVVIAIIAILWMAVAGNKK